jgi:hypothetical protein
MFLTFRATISCVIRENSIACFRKFKTVSRTRAAHPMFLSYRHSPPRHPWGRQGPKRESTQVLIMFIYVKSKKIIDSSEVCGTSLLVLLWRHSSSQKTNAKGLKPIKSLS